MLLDYIQKIAPMTARGLRRLRRLRRLRMVGTCALMRLLAFLNGHQLCRSKLIALKILLFLMMVFLLIIKSFSRVLYVSLLR
jgi:hypothetical protein